jgi:hypothetical protein
MIDGGRSRTGSAVQFIRSDDVFGIVEIAVCICAYQHRMLADLCACWTVRFNAGWKRMMWIEDRHFEA